MPEIKNFTKQQVIDMLDPDPGFRAHSIMLFDRWLDRGDGIAVYENQAFDSADFGHHKFVSYGSMAAQLVLVDGETTPPAKLPDVGGDINWRYQLIGVCREPEAPEPEYDPAHEAEASACEPDLVGEHKLTEEADGFDSRDCDGFDVGGES